MPDALDSSTMTQAELLAIMRATRSEWEALLSQLAPQQMTQPRTVQDWSIKDVIFHCASYARFYVNALEAQRRGEPPPLEGTDYAADYLSIDDRNELHFQQSQQRSVTEVLAEAHQVFQQLIELVAAQSEQFLIEPQRFEGVPEPVLVWKGLVHTCNHYRGHMQDIRKGLEKSAL